MRWEAGKKGVEREGGNIRRKYNGFIWLYEILLFRHRFDSLNCICFSHEDCILTWGLIKVDVAKLGDT